MIVGEIIGLTVGLIVGDTVELTVGLTVIKNFSFFLFCSHLKGRSSR